MTNLLNNEFVTDFINQIKHDKLILQYVQYFCWSQYVQY